MGKLTKNRKISIEKVDSEKSYTLEEASSLVKEITTTKFDSSVDLAIRLGVDPKKANEMVRGVVSLPHGTGKTLKLLALVTPDKEEEAKKAGADLVGLDEYVEKIKKGWVDVDVIVTMPSVMGKLGPLGKVLGPRGLMPNPKTGTVTMDIAKAVTEIKGGKIDFKVDKTGIIHASVGKVSFTADKIMDNANELINTIVKLKPSGSKGTYIKSISMSSTMSPGIAIESKFE
ncbi:50S ribosomal protein L1 [Flavobacteriaceae bacterium]|jgi:large subunit ribosomal protein L1|nr:50S ribosomal protein L1 [Cryomorphaceae bacterium]MDB3967622.1 50S ribosomal protein L1 [Flavobacteriaceae bacterium]MBT3503077.1 50S ribosomal protein L1 [Cryomorphaceae bacterium]MBT3689598.1 50S ribosomal protein L1 [Cryomorphaceae bacterium]MBT4221681.1 50S ribosomal protein L1 [Cryomorphaceae bacterium]